MKAKALLPILSFGLLMVGLTSVLSNPTGPITTTGQGIETPRTITYIVNIEHNDHLSGFNCIYYILVTDDRGRPVAPPQPFRLGAWTYQFQETGMSFTGTRIARMIRSKTLVCPEWLIIPPDAMTGTFKTGQSYMFDLVPMPSPGPVSEVTPGK